MQRLFNGDYARARTKSFRRVRRLSRHLVTYLLMFTGSVAGGVLGSVGFQLFVGNKDVAKLKQSIESLRRDASSSKPRKESKNAGEVGIAKRIVDEKGNRFNVFIADLGKNPLKIYYEGKSGEHLGTFERVQKYVEASGEELIFATNGGMFSANGAPVGLLIVNSKEITPLNLQNGSDGNFFLKPNGVFGLTNKDAFVMESSLFEKWPEKGKTVFATQSGPMLVINGSVHPKFNPTSSNVNIRSGVGIINSTQVAFAISEDNVNLFDFAMMFKKEFKCKNALYLDGFISRMYLPALERYDLEGDFGSIIAASK